MFDPALPDVRQKFWIVGDDEDRAWSGAARAYIPIAQVASELCTRIPSETQLNDVLLKWAPDVAIPREFTAAEIMATLDQIDHDKLAAEFSAGEIAEATPAMAARLRAMAARVDFRVGAIAGEPPPVPLAATKLGLMRALKEIDLWDAAKAAIASAPDVQEEWDLAIEIRRTDPLTQGMIGALGLSDEQVDQVLIRAAALVA